MTLEADVSEQRLRTTLESVLSKIETKFQGETHLQAAAHIQDGRYGDMALRLTVNPGLKLSLAKWNGHEFDREIVWGEFSHDQLLLVSEYLQPLVEKLSHQQKEKKDKSQSAIDELKKVSSWLDEL
tara:strand:+ start:2060 stop:2437 length:378 start_codon:yes stop_codon:yes gene_type:complete